MAISWHEIKERALKFSKEWEDEASEDAEAKSFWDGFFNVFGVNRRRLASFEEPVKRLRDGGKTATGYIDLFWKGQLIVEHKSRGKNLDKAYAQALDYFPGIPERDLPRYILVSDFERLRLYDLDTGTQDEFALKELHKNIKRFGFIAGYAPQVIKPQDPVNIKAAERLGKLHDQLKASGYGGHDLEVLLVRLVFCLFAEDTGIFPTQAFRDWLETQTKEDGADLGVQLALLFQVLNTPEAKRQKNLDEQLAAFAYINGKLFAETLQVAVFDSKMRSALLDCCALQWGGVSPAIFGALFQSIMDVKARRNLGAHYTSEENILKLIKPLFLDELWSEFERSKSNKNKLFDFHKKLRSLTFLDPACGCGNFLVITYRELRLLELDVLRASLHIERESGQKILNVQNLISIDVDQFYGIEIEEFPVQIAQVALWLADHQMNQKVSEEFGMYFARIPLTTSPHIVQGNALRLDWNDVIAAKNCSYVLGNPPFVGAKYMADEQRSDAAKVLEGIEGGSLLDFVSAWYVKATRYIQSTTIRCAFVSTNSITQGEQVGILWGWLLPKDIYIHFAHRTFQWSNEARGMAAVHCVIIGFAAFETAHKMIFDYDDIQGEPHGVPAANINPYLVDAPNILLPRRNQSICDVPSIRYGNMAIDGGHLVLDVTEKNRLLTVHPEAASLIKSYIGSEEFLNKIERYCLWLKDASPSQIRNLPEIMSRVDAVKQFRLTSKRPATRELAATPSLFGFISHRETENVVIPRMASARRQRIPIGYLPANTIVSDQCFMLDDGTKFHFGVLSSEMHMSWLRHVCGRLKSDFRYSNSIVYNNFPWPDSSTDKQVQVIEQAAQAVLDARAQFPDASLADLYDPNTMPPALVKAHQKLDAAVDAAYGKKGFNSDAERVAFLFELYQKYTSLLPSVIKPRKTRQSK